MSGTGGSTDHAAAPLPARTPVAARVLPDSVFYGWYVAVACALLMFVSVGVGYYGLAVFLRPLRDAHGWSNAVVSGATGLYFTVSGITGALVGPRIDRRGPLPTQLIGVLLLGGAVSLIGTITTVWQLYALYAVLAVGFGLATAVAVNAILARWFITRRALAMSVSFTGVSVGGVVLSPLGTALIDRGGLELAGPVLGVLVVLIGVPMIVAVLVWDPAQMGLEPDDGAPPKGAVRAALQDSVQRRVWTRRQAARTVSFWAILVGFMLVLLAQTGFLIHQISFLEERFGSSQRAAFALSVTALGSIAARLVVGMFADRLDKRWLTVGLLVVQGSAVLAVVNVESIAVTYVLVLVVGFTIGNVYMMQSLLVSETFGIVSFGTISGLIGVAAQTGSGLGPLTVGWLEDLTDGYRVPFTVTALLTYAAAVAITMARPPTATDVDVDVDVETVPVPVEPASSTGGPRPGVAVAAGATAPPDGADRGGSTGSQPVGPPD